MDYELLSTLEKGYVEEIGTPRELRAMLNAYMPQSSQYRLHSSLDGFVPANRYLGQPLTQAGV
ncbi:MAG: hypothetical protein GX153_05495 [Clostridiaceae bacterium]|nr:hypothetical protein [Clostridiaceae bacterium]